MAGDSVNSSVTKLKKCFATAKGMFTRTETKLKTLQVKGNESVGNTLLQKLDIVSRLLEMVSETERPPIEDIMNVVDRLPSSSN